MTSTLTRPARTRPLALDPVRIHKGWIAPGIWGVDAAMSADGLWTFTANGAPDAWIGEYLPTGDQVTAKTMNAVRAMAARPAVLEHFRAQAAAAVAAGPSRRIREYALARRRLQVLDGQLVAEWHPDGMCACGGYLVGDLHLDACPGCIEQPPGKRIRCRYLVAHRACATPDPVRCDHYRCTDRALPAPCWTGNLPCCGCCDKR